MAIVANKVPQLSDPSANTVPRNALLGHIPGAPAESRILLGMRWTVVAFSDSDSFQCIGKSSAGQGRA